jgi:hypothetical protein
VKWINLADDRDKCGEAVVDTTINLYVLGQSSEVYIPLASGLHIRRSVYTGV